MWHRAPRSLPEAGEFVCHLLIGLLIRLLIHRMLTSRPCVPGTEDVIGESKDAAFTGCILVAEDTEQQE